MSSTNPRYPNLQEETLGQRQQAQSQGKSQGISQSGTAHPHPQEDFERTMDQQGNLVSDEYSFTDGDKKKGHSGADDEADLFDAAQADFDDL